MFRSHRYTRLHESFDFKLSPNVINTMKYFPTVFTYIHTNIPKVCTVWTIRMQSSISYLQTVMTIIATSIMNTYINIYSYNVRT